MTTVGAMIEHDRFAISRIPVNWGVGHAERAMLAALNGNVRPVARYWVSAWGAMWRTILAATHCARPRSASMAPAKDAGAMTNAHQDPMSSTRIEFCVWAVKANSVGAARVVTH